MSEIAIKNIRVITQEMISSARSGHPGIALGAAPILHTLYSKVMKFNPDDPKWFNRDRFVLAAGHGSSLLYVLMHLCGYDVSIDDLKNFRQLHSKTAGHPEIELIKGIDASSGPLGQGIPTAVGMAISEAFLRNRYNKEGFEIFNNYTYVLCGDGDLQEGITCEAISLCGHLNLNKVIVLYDSNDIQLDGSVSMCNSENVKEKMISMNWNYILVTDGENVSDILNAINESKKSTKPTLIEIKTVIGKTSTKENSCEVHGSPLSEEEVIKMRKNFGLKPFEFYESVTSLYQDVVSSNKEIYRKEKELLSLYEKNYPVEYMELNMFLNCSDQLTLDCLKIPYSKDSFEPTRNVIGKILKNVSDICPILIGGSADVSKSTTVFGADGNFTNETPFGRNICFGVREHAMASICNGISLYGITKAFCGGFFVFCDYLKPSIRMSSLMKLPVMYFFSHDSIAVGEDGPTHQPIEHLTMLRSIPNVNVIRPASTEETKEAFVIAYNAKTNPTVVVLSRQKIKEVREESSSVNLTSNGAYILKEAKGNLDGILLASGSEVNLCLDIQKELEKDGINFRVVSMPSMFLFDKMDLAYKEKVLPKDVYTIAIEMSEAVHYYKYVRKVFSIDCFGKSGKLEDVINYFGFNTVNLVNIIKNDLLNKI